MYYKNSQELWPLSDVRDATLRWCLYVGILFVSAIGVVIGLIVGVTLLFIVIFFMKRFVNIVIVLSKLLYNRWSYLVRYSASYKHSTQSTKTLNLIHRIRTERKLKLKLRTLYNAPYVKHKRLNQKILQPQSKLVPIFRPRKDSRLGEPRACKQRCRGSNRIPPNCDSGEVTTTLSHRLIADR